VEGCVILRALTVVSQLKTEACDIVKLMTYSNSYTAKKNIGQDCSWAACL